MIVKLCFFVFLRMVYCYIFLIMMDIYDKFVFVGEIYCDGCVVLFVIIMYVVYWFGLNII